MQSALKPYATAGVAIVGAGILAVTPVAASLPEPAVRTVALTADGSPLGDVLAPWLDQYNAAAENLTQLANNFYVAPFVGLQQMIANQGDFWQNVADDPTKFAELTLGMQDNANALFNSFTLLDADDETVAAVTAHTLSADVGAGLLGHYDLVGFLPTLLDAGLLPLPDDVDTDMIGSIVNFLASPASGIIMGALGPVISPVIGLMNSIDDGDGFNEILANTVGAFFNGATLDLDSVLPAINDAGALPEGMSIDHLELAFGGLFTGGDVANAPYTFYDASGAAVSEVPGAGGSILNALGIDITGVPAINELGFEGHAVGPIGAWEGLSAAIAGVLGADAWASPWSAKSQPAPPPADPPLTGASFPLIDDEIFDGSTIPDTDPGSAAADAAALADLLAAWGV